MPLASVAAAPSPSLPRALASSSKGMSCEKCYVSKSKCDFSFPCERCFRLNLPCRPRVRGGGLVLGRKRRRKEVMAIEEQTKHQHLPNGLLQGVECMGGPGSTSTEEADDDDQDEDGEEGEEEGEERHTQAITWTNCGRQVSKRHAANSPVGMKSSSKKSKKGSNVKREDTPPSLVDLVFERVNGAQMSETYVQAFNTLQQRGHINREGMLALLRQAKRLSDVCGSDVTLGAAGIIAKALRVTPQELMVEEDEGEGCSNISSAAYISERARRQRMAEEVRTEEAAAARLKASPLFQQRDDGRTAMVVIEMNRAKARMVAVGNQAYLDVFPSPSHLLSQEMSRRCWSPFLFAALVAHGDREAWFRVNMEALCSAPPREMEEGGGRERQKERQLYSEFVKTFSREGQVLLYWARLAQVEAGGEGEKPKKQLHEHPLQDDDEEGREDAEVEDDDQEEGRKEGGGMNPFISSSGWTCRL
ncbi:zn-c6 fungal-type dna-binding domain protein, partial [Nannochloropsis oceanica]